MTSMAISAAPLLTGTAHAVTGAGFTTVNETIDGSGHCLNGNPSVNCNIYDGKQYVWLNGGPSVAYVGNGSYFFAVLSPGGQADPNDGAAKNLSSPNDAYTNRTFTVTDGVVSYSGTHDFNSNKIRLMPYDDTLNPGGVYILAVCSLSAGYPVDPSSCKYDAFKVNGGSGPGAADPSVTKDAAGAYTDTWTWDIQKDVDKTLVQTTASSATFNYTVTVTHDSGTVADVQVTGTIDVINPNVDSSSQTAPITIKSVTDQLSDGTVCAVDTTGTQTGTSTLTLDSFDNYFPYTCTLSALPPGSLDNTVTADWDAQTLSNGDLLAVGSADFTFPDIAFTATNVDDRVTVTDPVVGTLGTVSQSDPSPTTFTYSASYAMVPSTCQTYDNTATFTTDTTGTTDHASQSVQVCGPVAGGLTIGFWQNKNGQGIIKTGSAPSNVCASATWLRQYAPFQDLSATATCTQVATYVTNVIKAANAGGASMNAMLKAQMLATALDVYFSDPALGGNRIGAPVPLGGVKVDLTNIGGENTSSAFGGASSMTVGQLLTYAAGQSNVGGTTWYGQNKATQGLAKDTFDAINNGVAFVAP